jgi:Tol biopolymer transport system component
MAKFKQALSENPPLPEGFGGRVILSGPYQGNNNLWKSTMSNLDGSNPRLLGDSDGSFSPDGSKVAFSRYGLDESAELGIFITDLITNQTVHLPGTVNFDFNPIWSPDGSQIVFNRGGNLYDLYIIHTDGTNLRPLTSNQGQEYPVGWMPDGQHLLYTLPGATYQHTNHIVDVQTGQTEYFSDDEFLAMSPDARYKLIAERDPSNMDIWVTYLSNLDGSNRWALAESDVILPSAFWSKDGEWLLVSVFMRNDEKYTPAFIHLTDCQIIPLPKIDGMVIDWQP